MKILAFALAVFMSQNSIQISDIIKPKVELKVQQTMNIQEYINYCNQVMAGIASELESYEYCMLSRSFWRFKSAHLYMMLLYMQSLDQHARVDEEWQSERAKFQAWLIYVRTGKGDDYNGWNVRRLKEVFSALKNAYRHHKHRLRYWEYANQERYGSVNEQRALQAA